MSAARLPRLRDRRRELDGIRCRGVDKIASAAAEDIEVPHLRIAPKLLLLNLMPRRMSVTASGARPAPRSEPMGWTPPPSGIDASFDKSTLRSEMKWYLFGI